MNTRRYLLSLMVVLSSAMLQANVSLPSIFADHMVLQQNSEVKLWGWGKPLEKITVKASWAADTLKTEVDSEANWSVTLKTPEAGGPYAITVQGYNTVQLQDVMIGEVWLLSGQSNMEWTTRGGVIGDEAAVKEADRPHIRLFTVTPRTAAYPTHDVGGTWSVCSPETMIDFSAVGYFFGQKLEEELDVPIGLICSSWGGTPIEVWMPEEAISGNTRLMQSAQSLEKVPWGPVGLASAYNAMIAPMVPYGIAGALWYQGEANTANPDTYADMLEALVTSWRKAFEKDFPFYYAQIAPWNSYWATTGVEVREEQRRALSIENTGMIVVSDIGDTVDIHPRNKIDVGLRFANLVLNQTYGKSELPVSGPLFKSFEVKGKKLIVHFTHAEGLHAKGDALKMFEVMNNEGTWVRAKARIKGTDIEVYAPQVKAPGAVRFAWSNAATPGLFNAQDLPASCFNSAYKAKELKQKVAEKQNK